MRQPINLIIKKGKQRKERTSLIFLQYCYSQTKRILIGTDIEYPKSSTILAEHSLTYSNIKVMIFNILQQEEICLATTFT